MRICITDFPTPSQIRMASGHASRRRLPGMGAPPLEWDFRNIHWVSPNPPSSLRAARQKTHCLNKRTAAANPKLELHLQGDGEYLLEQPPVGNDIHIYPFNVVSYPSPSRWILVSLHRRRTIPIVQLLLEERLL